MILALSIAAIVASAAVAARWAKQRWLTDDPEWSDDTDMAKPKPAAAPAVKKRKSAASVSSPLPSTEAPGSPTSMNKPHQESPKPHQPEAIKAPATPATPVATAPVAPAHINRPNPDGLDTLRATEPGNRR